MKKSIYRINVEVTHMKDSLLPADCGGAFVNVYLVASNIREAIDLAESELLSENYKPIETTSAYQLDSDEYEGEYLEEGDPKKEDLERLFVSRDVWFGCFNLYPVEDQNVH